MNGCGRLRTVADGCERLRTVADADATSSEHTLNPQTPRVKREPLLRIREKVINNGLLMDMTYYHKSIIMDLMDYEWIINGLLMDGVMDY